MSDSASHKARLLADLRARLSGQGAAAPGQVRPVDLNVRCGGPHDLRLARGRVHEIRPDRPGHGAAAGFAARCLAGTQRGDTRPVLWVASPRDRAEEGRLYLPGLVQAGLVGTRLLTATPRRAKDVLWVLEEALASGALAGVAAWVGELGLTPSRRLALAAESQGTPLFLLRPWADQAATSVETRWRVGPLPSAPNLYDPQAPGQAVWQLTRKKARQGPPATWEVVCNGPKDALDLAAHAGDRTLAARVWPDDPFPDDRQTHRHARAG
ncbi:MAG: hypothetical protein AAGK00_09420 [Pseudomonadota bacterium]